MTHIVLVAHNLRSSHNVGSLLRTADGLGIERVVLTGYTPHPTGPSDGRLPHISRKVAAQIHKTALGAEESVSWGYYPDVFTAIKELRDTGYLVAALEQTADAVALPEFKPPEKLAILVGRETEGVEAEVLKLCDEVLEIPMYGRKESFNVVQAAAMALYHCRFR